MTGEQKFLLFSVAGRNCAIPAERVAELAVSSTVHDFPHGSSEIAGVVLRHGRVVPLYRVADLMRGLANSPGAQAGSVGGAAARETSLQYQVIAIRQFAGTSERAAFTVDGACDLVNAESLPAKVPEPAVAGELKLDGKTYTVLDLDKLLNTDSEA